MTERKDPSGELAAWLALAHVAGIGGSLRQRLLDHFGSAEAVIQAPDRELAALDVAPEARADLHAPDWAAVEAEMRWAEGPAHHLLRESDPRWPPLLRQIPDPPPLLYCHGDPTHLRDPGLAMVGSRNPTRGGRETAHDFAEALSKMGLVITSGLAMGVDAAAHQGALDAGGPTIAVMGTGPDVIYPRRNAELAAAIADSGCLVSEHPPGTQARRGHFPRRNRIIAGLSLGTLVIEAALRSGSLITARLAAEQGREVFAVPGSIHNPLARGCHRLIRAGAKLVESTDDILEELRGIASLADELDLAPADPDTAARQSSGHSRSDPAYESLLEAVDFSPTPVDRIIERSGLTAASVSSMLLMLELEGRVESAPGGRYIRRN
ncbi:DNA-processing protein DprA [Natronospira bacteriovora]|uniref:DNA-processing protein DprA n=1 Tax=Natronospira bacteriovora TaxID=3069753 RepID=A0ABU0WA29_9GAMM|nr:DNA-processing protein DprA [Natronospira sp. AB-CW4]MDQ2070894.1 DNA-processing protein DprA [Natronospira sp. AB-CW4]